MSISKNTLEKYLNDSFVETGTCEGDGVVIALDCGFRNIHSIEIDPNLYEICKNRFDGKTNVNLYCGDSVDILPSILSSLGSTATFWLDAHMNDVSIFCGKFRCPIVQEINMILSHNIKHTLLIDDRRLFIGNGIAHWGNVNEDNILTMIKNKDKGLKISYEDGYAPNDIIVVKYE